jgi:hypothetical protein
MDPPGLERKLRIRALRFFVDQGRDPGACIHRRGNLGHLTFWYREKYLPEVSDTDVTVRIVAEALGERDGVVTVRARTVLENPGPRACPGPGRSVVARGQRPARSAAEDLKQPPSAQGCRSGVHRAGPDPRGQERAALPGTRGQRAVRRRNAITVRPGGHLEDETILFVRREEYSV